MPAWPFSVSSVTPNKKEIAIAIPFPLQALLPMAPMVAMPATAPAPMAVTPTPVTVTPAPVPVMPVAVPPAHLLGLELGCFLAAGDSGMSVRVSERRAPVPEHLRR